MNVLVIEDDKITLNSLKYVIESLGHKVAIAENAETAIRKVEEEKFDLIISDIMMPGLSGLSLLSILRTMHLCKAPIIAMSTLNNKTLLDAAFEAGANDFMIKPFTFDGISEKLKKFENYLIEEEDKEVEDKKE